MREWHTHTHIYANIHRQINLQLWFTGTDSSLIPDNTGNPLEFPTPYAEHQILMFWLHKYNSLHEQGAPLPVQNAEVGQSTGQGTKWRGKWMALGTKACRYPNRVCYKKIISLFKLVFHKWTKQKGHWLKQKTLWLTKNQIVQHPEISSQDGKPEQDTKTYQYRPLCCQDGFVCNRPHAWLIWCWHKFD